MKRKSPGRAPEKLAHRPDQPTGAAASAEARDVRRLVASYAGATAVTFSALLGHRLGIFTELGRYSGGLTARDLARRLSLSLRYVEAWCKAAYAGDLIGYRTASRKFFLGSEMARVTLNSVAPVYFPGMAEAVAMGARMVDRVQEAMRSGEGIPFREYRGFAEQSMMLSHFAYEIYLPRYWLPAVPGLAEVMAEPGALAVELGCGAGAGLVALRRTFPNAAVMGCDPDPKSLRIASQTLRKAGLERSVRLIKTSAERLEIPRPATLVYTQLALHEMDRPEQAVKQVAKRLAPGGVFLIVEIRGSEKIEEAKGPLAQILTFLDLVYEIPQAIAKGGPGIGFFTQKDIRRLVRSAGLPPPKAVPFDNPLYAVFWTRKPH